MRKALLMLFGLKKHDLCFLVTLSRIGEYVVLWDSGDELLLGHKYEANGGRYRLRFGTGLEASEVSQSEKSIVAAF